MTGGHVPSVYAAGAGSEPDFPALTEAAKADVAIVGGGYTGLAAALTLAEAQVDVMLIEAERIGWGASGRNGGQIHTGQRRDQNWLEHRFGIDTARRLWTLAAEAKAYTLELIDRHDIDCDLRSGLIQTVHKPDMVAAEMAYVDKLRSSYHYDGLEWLDRDALAAAIGTDVYFGGWRDTGGGHLDPLKFAQGLGRAAAAAGARIHEETRALGIAAQKSTTARGAVRLVNQRIKTERGSVDANIIVLAGNGHLDGIEPEVETRVMPIGSYMLATEPIGAGRPGGPIPGGEAVSDSRFVVRYFRPSADGRLIFGGGETYSLRVPADVAGFVRKHMLGIYPQLDGARIDYAWGGRVAITRSRLPLIRRIRPGVYAAAGYSGQGVALAPFAGKILADAIRGDPARLDAFAALPVGRFLGGKLLRSPALALGMSWYALRDRM